MFDGPQNFQGTFGACCDQLTIADLSSHGPTQWRHVFSHCGLVSLYRHSQPSGFKTAFWCVQISGVVYMFRFPPQTALAVGLSMAQIGEFAFVLLSVASQLGLMPYQVYMLLMGEPSAFRAVINSAGHPSQQPSLIAWPPQ